MQKESDDNTAVYYKKDDMTQYSKVMGVNKKTAKKKGKKKKAKGTKKKNKVNDETPTTMPRFDIDASNVEVVQQMNTSEEEDYDQNPLSQDEESLDGDNQMEYSRPMEPSQLNPLIDSRLTSSDH
jgi:hypothetical protein